MELGSLEDWLKLAWVLIALSEGIINVNVLGSTLEFLEKLIANRGRGFLLSAAINLQTCVGRGSNNAVPVSHLDILVLVVEVVVSNTISNDPSLKVGNIAARILSGAISDVPVESFNQARYVNTGIGLSGDVEIVLLKLWELAHDTEDSLKVVISSVEIIPLALFLIAANGIADASRALNIDHVSFLVPGVWVLHESSGLISK